jgi:hypothetical protein
MMTRICSFASLLVMAVAVTPMHAQQDAAQQMIAADKALWQAMAGPQPDMAKVEAGYAKDYVDVSFGTVHTREEDMEQTKAMRNFSFEYANPHAVVLSPTSGYVVAEISYFGMVGGSSFKNKVLTTTVFSLEKGQWLARVQMSEPSTAPAKTIAVSDDDPTLVALRKLAGEVEAKVHVPGYAAFPAPKVKLDAGTIRPTRQSLRRCRSRCRECGISGRVIRRTSRRGRRCSMTCSTDSSLCMSLATGLAAT